MARPPAVAAGVAVAAGCGFVTTLTSDRDPFLACWITTGEASGDVGDPGAAMGEAAVKVPPKVPPVWRTTGVLQSAGVRLMVGAESRLHVRSLTAAPAPAMPAGPETDRRESVDKREMSEARRPVRGFTARSTTGECCAEGAAAAPGGPERIAECTGLPEIWTGEADTTGPSGRATGNDSDDWVWNSNAGRSGAGPIGLMGEKGSRAGLPVKVRPALPPTGAVATTAVLIGCGTETERIPWLTD